MGNVLKIMEQCLCVAKDVEDVLDELSLDESPGLDFNPIFVEDHSLNVLTVDVEDHQRKCMM